MPRPASVVFALGMILIALPVLPAAAALPVAHAPATRRVERDAPVASSLLSRPSRPARAGILDYSQSIDANDIRMFVTNTGSFAWDLTTGSAGLEFPRGSGNTAVFAGGLWLGALVNGTPRVTVAEYGMEYGPGQMVGGSYDNPNQLAYRTFKLLHDYPDGASRDAALADYNANAVPHGAPVVNAVGGTSLDIVGSQMLWSVFNDANAGLHTGAPGHTAPLGVEVRHTTYAFADAGPLGRTIFMRYEILNRGANVLQSLRVGLWADPDLGSANDDLAGYSPHDGLGYVYNGTNNDGVYGTKPPAVGFDLVSRFDPTAGVFMEPQAFTVYVNGTDPVSSVDAWYRLAGLNSDGSPIIDPTTGLPTTFMFNGDPLPGTGWIDPTAADKRFLLAAQLPTLAPGQSITTTWAIVVGQSNDRYSSLSQLICDDRTIQGAFDGDFRFGPYPRVSCGTVVNCVKPSDYWGEQCPAGSDFSAAQMSEIARRVDAQSNYFVLDRSGLIGLCGVFGGTQPRYQAEQEYMALLCNLAASRPPIVPASGQTFSLDTGTPIHCPGFAATSIDELTAPAQRTVLADYVDRVTTHPAPIEGVNFLLPAYGGGAGSGMDFFGSSINPFAQPDSMAHVELRFDRTHPQKAYRYLRFEQIDGSPPPGGRGYVFAGMHDVPFTCWDVDHGVQLDAAFAERTIVDGFGTIQPIGNQVATFDSTWSPDDSQFGGREYLFVFSRGYGPAPKPELAQDGLILEGTGPVLYGLAARRTAPTTVFDDGDAFAFAYEYPLGPSVDAMLLRLATMPPSQADPYYSSIASCLSDINHGIGIGATCDQTTATLASLVRADAEPDRVSLAWLLAPAAPVELERRASSGTWAFIARLLPDGSGRVTYEDRDVVAGSNYGYRLRLEDGATAGETAVAVPVTASLRLTGFVPNPARGAARIAFALPGRGPATLSVFDVAGRRLRSLEVGSLGPGSHTVPVGTELASGVYLVRLEQSGKILTLRSALIR